jgi:hypothetical protein
VIVPLIQPLEHGVETGYRLQLKPAIAQVDVELAIAGVAPADAVRRRHAQPIGGAQHGRWQQRLILGEEATVAAPLEPIVIGALGHGALDHILHQGSREWRERVLAIAVAQIRIRRPALHQRRADVFQSGAQPARRRIVVQTHRDAH